MTLGIRPAQLEDAAAIARLETELFGGEAWSLAQVRDELGGPGRRAWVAIPSLNERSLRLAVAGYLVTMTHGDVSDLQRVGVAPDAQLCGVASSLLETAVAAAVRDGAHRMLLEVAEDNAAALAFYGSRGFHEIDRRPRYYRQTVAALVMQRVLTGQEAQ